MPPHKNTLENNHSELKQAKKSLLARDTYHRDLIDYMRNGYAYCQVIYKDGHPLDFIHKEVNASYETMTGLVNVTGMSATEVFPGIEKSHPEFISKQAKVAQCGIPDRFELYMEPLALWLDISVHSPKKGYFVSMIENITERKQAEITMMRNEARFRKLFESHSAVKMLLDPDTGNIIDANFAAADFYGWSIEELRRMHIQDLNPLTDQAAITNLGKSNTSKQNRFLCQHLKADGSLCNVEVFSNKIEIEDQELLYAIIHDVSDRKLAEEALLESEARFRRLFQEHSATMMLIEPDTGNIIDANHAAADFYGWSIEELCRMRIQEINTLPPEEVKEEMQKSKSSKQNHFLFRHLRADGSVRDVEVFSNKVEVAGNILLYSIIHDVTERTRYEFLNTFRLRILQMAETSSVEELLRTALDEAELLTKSTIGFVFFIAKDQMSLSLQVCSTNTLRNKCPVNDMGTHYPLEKAGVWADAIRERRTVIHNDYAALKHRKGMPESHMPVTRELVVPVIRDDRIVALMGIGNKPGDYDENDVNWSNILANLTWDIVAKKIAEEEREKLQYQLQHSQKMEMVGQLAAGIAHEINNPLNFITINFANIREITSDLQDILKEYKNITNKLENGTFSPLDLKNLRQKEAELALDSLVNDIPEILLESQRGFERITTIINGMRNLSHRYAIDRKSPFDINKGIMDTLLITSHDHGLYADIKTTLGELPLILCNPEQINQVFINLIINSVHAIQSQQRSSKGIITLRTWFDSGNVYCSITDDGPGIPETIRNDIFNPFFTTKSSGKNTGLGLSIAYDIMVIKHNGTISVDCPAEGGTVFTLSLPRQTP
jgi:PAS domain S-box-containing protein